MSNDNTKTSNTSQTNDVPQVFSEDVLPPMPQNNVVSPTAPTANTTPIDETKVDPVVEQKTETNDSGSAAPSNDINLPPVVMGTTPKKKFGSGKVIATILGLFLLVGGVGAGTMLVQQQQDIRERAGACADNPCGPGFQCDGSGGCIPRGSGDDYRGPVYEPPDNPWDNGGSDSNDTGGCAIPCGGPGLAFDFCLPAGSTKTCNQEALDRGYSVPIGSGCQPGQDCSVPAGYICKVGVNGYNGGPCTNSNKVPGTGSITSVPNCFCGTIQIDGGPNDGTYQMQCGCDDDTPPADKSTPPVFTASCQYVKAYPTSGNSEVPLTQTQLSALRSGDVINLCVQGQKSGGTFTKMRWTINGSLQAEEAVTDRVGTTNEGKFCKTYTIPATLPNNGAFTFKAELYHSTLGWK